jgi:prevent-host-death family protein
MKNTWQLQKAKAEFSKLIDRSLKDGPQVVTRRGEPTAVVLSVSEYERLRRKAPDFKEFLRTAPPLHELDLTRNKDTGRKIDL